MLKKIFVSFPYSDKDKRVVDNRVASAGRYCVRLLREGKNPICPAAFAHVLLQGDPLAELSYEQWMDYALALLSDGIDELHVLKLDGYDNSSGVQKEIEVAQGMSLPITYVDC